MRIGSKQIAGLLAAAWGLAAIGILSASTRAGDGDGVSDLPAVANTVRLEIQISGLGGNGGKVTIKPAHPSCKFKVVAIPIAKGAEGDTVKLDPITVTASTTSADRDCSFEITLTEPGRQPKTFRRGVRLNPPAAGATTAPSCVLKCRLPATAVAIKDDGKTTKR